MHYHSKPDEQECLVETWEDQAIRQAFQRWARKIKPPYGAWEAISWQVSRIESSKRSQKNKSKP